jgi:hypothetical protein
LLCKVVKLHFESCTIRTCNLHKGKRGNTNHKKGENTIGNTTSKNKEEIIGTWLKGRKAHMSWLQATFKKTKATTTWNTKHEQHYWETSLGKAMNSPNPWMFL